MSNLPSIQEALRNYKPGSRKSLAEIYFEDNDFTVTWQLNSLCNFDCPYCGRYTAEDPEAYIHSPQQIADSFNNTNKTWHIIISGGEPFLHKNLIEICRLLTVKHYISINTNLSSPKVIEFADAINPEKIIAINASIHYKTNEEKNTLDTFISNFLYLQEKGFNIVGSYVVFPSLLENYKEHINFLHSKGLKLITSKVFLGAYQNKNYPESYTEKDFNDIISFMCSEIDMPEYYIYTRFKGLKCSAGRNMFSMKPNGDLSRCLVDSTPLGNLFSGTYMFNEKDMKCKVKECLCPTFCMLFSKKQKMMLW